MPPAMHLLYRGKTAAIIGFSPKEKRKPTLWRRWQTKFIIPKCMKPMSMWQIPPSFEEKASVRRGIH